MRWTSRKTARSRASIVRSANSKISCERPAVFASAIVHLEHRPGDDDADSDYPIPGKSSRNIGAGFMQPGMRRGRLERPERLRFFDLREGMMQPKSNNTNHDAKQGRGLSLFAPLLCCALFFGLTRADPAWATAGAGVVSEVVAV